MGWADALVGAPYDPFLPAAVACEYLATGYDLIDDVYDLARDSSARDGLANALPAGVALLAQEMLMQLDVPQVKAKHASVALARASRRVLAAQAEDYVLRLLPVATQGDVLAIMRRRSGTLVTAPCQCAALLAGAPWRVVALAGRFGHALGCAGQLEDDLADRVEDRSSGRKTLPIVLDHLYPSAPEVVEASTWVLIQRFLQEAARTLHRLPIGTRTEPLWTLLPPAMHTPSHA